ncbi:MAG: DUF4252 domain-containing protein [Candidatus Cyclobacteriaceae bacterium M3_2C_046]
MTRLLFLIILYPFLGYSSPNDDLNEFFEKHSGNKSLTKINVSGKMFSLFQEFDNEDQDMQKLSAAISKLEGLHILAADSLASNEANSLYADAMKLVTKNRFDELATIRHKNENVQFMIKENTSGVIQDLLVLVKGDHKFFFLNLFGEINLSELPELSRMKMKGMEYLNDMHDAKKQKKDNK